MRVTYDCDEFDRQTGMICDPEKVRSLGLYTKDVIASFYKSDVQDLLDFCAENPKYHIVTILTPSIYVNRYDDRASMFHLANGDQDPNYMLNLTGQWGWIYEEVFKCLEEHLHSIKSPDIKARAYSLLESFKDKSNSRKKT